MNFDQYHPKTTVHHQPFLVFKDPFCQWDVDLEVRSLEYLNSIDPIYFSYAAHVHEPYLKSEDKKQVQYAALAIRTTYSHSLETLFALIGAALQAPGCPVGWMVRYQNKNLNELIRSIQTRQPFNCAFKLERQDWEQIAGILIPVADHEKQQLFATLWRRLAQDFLDEKREDEYNSIKHGLRVAAGGFTLAFGLETTPGVPAPPEAMRSMGGSAFGSSYYSVELVQQKPNFQVRRNSLNWLPENMLAAIDMVCMSIGNIVSFLKAQNGADTTTLPISVPQDDAAFDEPWKYSPGITSFNMDRQVYAPSVTPLTPAEIRAACSVQNDTDQK